VEGAPRNASWVAGGARRFSLYLTYLELFVIDAICQWCVLSAVLMALSLAVAALRAFAYAGTGLGTAPLQSEHGR
jgi:uncharacterized membrane protein